MIFNNTSHIGILQICQWAYVYKYLRLSLYCENISNTAIFWLENEKKAKKYILNIADCGASLVVQWLRIHPPMQRTQVRALVREDPTCRGTTKPVSHNYWAWALEPATHNYWNPRTYSPCSATREATAMRSPRTITKSSLCSPQLEKAHATTKTQCSQK